MADDLINVLQTVQKILPLCKITCPNPKCKLLNTITSKAAYPWRCVKCKANLALTP